MGGLGESLIGAFALMLIIEGLLPFVSPKRWREVFERATRMADGQIRFIGMVSIAAGCVMLLIWR